MLDKDVDVYVNAVKNLEVSLQSGGSQYRRVCNFQLDMSGPINPLPFIHQHEP